jgi:branched-chain amino acid transport system permease protein
MNSATLHQRAKELAPRPGPCTLRGAAAPVAGILLAIALHRAAAPLLDALFDRSGDYGSRILIDIGINIILAVSLTMVNGFTGQFSIGHAGFMAVGAYTGAAIVYYGSLRLWGSAALHGGFISVINPAHLPPLYRHLPVDWGDLLFLGACLAGGLAAAVVGLAVGLPSLRLRGDYLAIVTLGFGEIARILLQQTHDVLSDPAAIRATPWWQCATHCGGPLGFSDLPPYTTLFWVFLCATATLLAAYRLKISTFGRAFLSIRENPIAADAVGIPTTRFKVAAFVISAFFAGIAGVLFAHKQGTLLTPADAGFQRSFDIVIMVVLGGMGSVSGAAIAAILLTVLPELLRAPPHLYPLALVAIAVLFVVRGRRGLRAALGIALAAGLWEAAKLLADRAGINLADYRMVIYALCLILIMILRPRGLFGLHELWDLPFRRPRPGTQPPQAGGPA